MEQYRKSVEEVLAELGAVPGGLNSGEAVARLNKYGANKLAEAPKEPGYKKLVKQFTEFIILVLIGAAIIAGLLGEYVDAIAILAIVVLNGAIGYTQEEKAERVLDALKKMSAPQAKVFRDGEVHTIDAADLVTGDVVRLDAGDNIPADLRVIQASMLRIEEAALTGESHPVDKDPGALADKLPLGDRINSAFMGTTVVYGRGRGLVVATGMATEMGKIARMLQEVKREPTPLQKRLDEFGRLLVYISGAICALIFAIGLLRNEDTLVMFLTAVSLAVAAIPEGLPAVVTIVLALGVQRMVKRHALIRKLPSVETLGAATIIASDKTGTITQNQMTVRKLYLATGETVDVTGAGYEPAGRFLISSGEKSSGEISSGEIDPGGKVVLATALKAAALCNTSSLKEDDDGWHVIGDPTEGALLTVAAKAGFTVDSAGAGLTLVGEVPFDGQRKMMTVVYDYDKDAAADTRTAYTKGAPERVLPLCTGALGENGPVELTEEMRRRVREVNEEMAGGALRVLALAMRTTSGASDGNAALDIHAPHELETDLTFIGLIAMIDPPRDEVFVAMEKAKEAGITPIMITGDHRLTAEAIAREVGAFTEGDLAVTGVELDEMTDEEFREKLPFIKVYARVNPEHKLMVVRAWRERGDIIAMTGDGVNDAPALKEADIGVAMGITGTDVTKEAGDMVLTDDNFASIVDAVEEGRGIFDNIRRVVHFLLSCNIGEILVLLVASLTGMPLPLLPVQILWTNLVTDGLPALGLAMEPVDQAVMDRKPRGKDEGIVTKSLMWIMLVQGVFMAACTLAAYVVVLYWWDGGLDKARTVAFTVLVFCQKFHVFNCRSEFESVFKIGPFTNRMLNWAVAIILVSQVLIVHIPSLEEIFKVTALDMRDWALVFAASVQPLVWMEVVKFVRNRRKVAA